MHSPSASRVPHAHTGAFCKDLLSGGGHVEGKNDHVTSKPTDLNPKDREVKYGELNYYCDYRKRSN